MQFTAGDELSSAEFIHDRTDESLYLRQKIAVGILGATGSVGQRLVQLLERHPWFTLVSVAASDKSVGKSYKEATNWMQSSLMPQQTAILQVVSCEPNLPCKIVFSALSSSVAGPIEEEFAKKGYVVISMAKNHRMDENVPMVIPEVNSSHLPMLKRQKFSQTGMIITKPNCSVIGLALALRPLQLEFGIDAVHVVTMQSASGAGYPGVPSLQLLDNVIPYIDDEEEKLETELLKLFGTCRDTHLEPYPMKISANCNRVPVTEGHLEVVSVQLKKKATEEEIKRAWREFESPIQGMRLPTSPAQTLYYFDEKEFPQPKLHRELEKGMAVSIGRLRRCSLLDYKFVCLSHNTIRGAAGGALLIAELLVKEGYIFW